MRRILDLTLPLESTMRGVEVEEVKRLEIHGWNATRLGLYSHCGTHMDAPRHFLPEGATVDSQPLGACIGPARLVDLTPVEDFLTKFPHQLSGGQRQRVSVARALTVNPSFIVADEAVSMVDVSIRVSLLNMLSRLKEELGVTYLFITHDLALAKFFAWEGRIAVMYVGSLVEVASTPQLINDPQHPYTQALLAAARRIDKEMPDLPLTQFLAKMLTPSFTRACEIHVRAIAQLRSARAGLAAEPVPRDLHVHRERAGRADIRGVAHSLILSLESGRTRFSSTGSTPPMIRVRDLSKTFYVHKKAPGLRASLRSLFVRERVAKHAVAGVSLDVSEGEWWQWVERVGDANFFQTSNLQLPDGWWLLPRREVAPYGGYGSSQRHRYTYA